MFLNLKLLLHLPVYTKSGTHLGQVRDAKFDVTNHSVKQYTVGSRIFGRERYLIAPTQVLSITAEQMTVQDSVVAESVTQAQSVLAPQPDLGNIASRLEE